MKILDRYLYAVGNRLPENIRQDVTRELRTNIEEMLPDNPTDDQVYQQLQELGNPW